MPISNDSEWAFFIYTQTKLGTMINCSHRLGKHFIIFAARREKRPTYFKISFYGKEPKGNTY